MTTQRQDSRHEPDEQRADERESPEQHRIDVVRRLLAHGMSSRSIAAVLPGWGREIAAASAERRVADRRDLDARD